MKFECRECVGITTDGSEGNCVLDVGSSKDAPKYCPYERGFCAVWEPLNQDVQDGQAFLCYEYPRCVNANLDGCNKKCGKYTPAT